MILSREHLLAEAAATGFRADMLEKVLRLLALLDALRSHPFLRGRIALKGGTALNLFVFDVPRLSVDIDLNYVGGEDRETMLADKPKVEQAVIAVCQREGFSIRQVPTEHAGGKFQLRYQSPLGQGGNLEVDINFVFRVPLWPISHATSRAVGSHSAHDIPLLDLHEVAAGKLAALLARHASRDLFDAHRLLTTAALDGARLRTAFVVYGGINRKDWRTVSVADVAFEPREMANQLVPLLRAADGPPDRAWTERIADECRTALAAVLPLSPPEREFLDRLLDHGEIAASLITADANLAARIELQPGLLWKAQHVKAHRRR